MSQSRILVVVTDAADAAGAVPERVVEADRYLEGRGWTAEEGLLVINLCRSYAYGSKGYYVSLLADARAQRVIPTLDSISALAEPYACFRALQEAGVPTVDPAEMAVRQRRARISGSSAGEGAFPTPLSRNGEQCRPAGPGEVAETFVCLGTCPDAEYQNVAGEVFRRWPAPLLRIQLLREDGEWKVTGVATAAPHELGDAAREHLAAALRDQRITGLASRAGTGTDTVRASIAVLVDPSDPFSPSSPETIDRLERVAARRGIHIARLALDELRKLPEYDALFVRSNTWVTHAAFQFALRAESLGMPVVDDTQSTIRCTNKVFVDELLRREGVATPRTVVVTRRTPWAEVEALGLPFVIKLPDAAFSTAVHKVQSREEFAARSQEMFERSPLLLAQEWLPTDFDWRIGILGGKLLFAAKYYMASGHWQIRTVESGVERYGRIEAVPRAEAPADVVDVALRAAALIGTGFYGVDVKESARGPVVIEINDNPNLDTGYEDTADGDAIYQDIIDYFVTRVEEATALPGESAENAVDMKRLRQPIRGAAPKREYGMFEVAGLELEYPIVDRDLNVVSLVEPAFRMLAGRGTSDIDLGAAALSNEFADHVLEVKTTVPQSSMRAAEDVLHEAVQRFGAVLREEFDARLMPTGMHPWFNPRDARLWTRSGLRVYTTYARIFDVRSHAWMNVHAAHVNVPFGGEAETMAMHTAAALLTPYLPAIAASSPVHDGQIQGQCDARLKWLTRLQDRVPESCGRIIPEFVETFADYRRNILQPMYAALDRIHDAGALRHEFFNARAAILRFSRRALEIRVLDVQECVKMDAAIAVFTRAALQALTDRVLTGAVPLPEHEVLVHDYAACVRDGSRARVHAPHILGPHDLSEERDARAVLRRLLALATPHVHAGEQEYLPLIADLIEQGSLAERIRAALLPAAAGSDPDLRCAIRKVYGELADALDRNTPWPGRGLPEIAFATAMDTEKAG